MHFASVLRPEHQQRLYIDRRVRVLRVLDARAYLDLDYEVCHSSMILGFRCRRCFAQALHVRLNDKFFCHL